MDFEIKTLSADLVDDYLHFFDTEDHSDNQLEHKCYCVCWCSDDHRSGLEKMSSAEKRRELAKEYVIKGMIQGYLAYDCRRVVGWCNANDKEVCQNCISWIRNMTKIKETDPAKVKSVFCFTIAKEYRRKGIASALLKRVCEDAKKDGYDAIEAYPVKVMKVVDAFEGPLEMYQKQGFIIRDDFKDYYLVYKQL